MAKRGDLTSDVLRHEMSQLARAGRYTILAIDHGNVLRSHVDGVGANAGADNLVRAKLAVMRTLAPKCSAVLVDLGLAQHSEFGDDVRSGPTGLVISVDEVDYDTVRQPPPAVPAFELVEQAKRAGASALKVVVYYDQTLEDAGVRLSRVSAISKLSEEVGLPLLVEPLPFDPEAGADWPVATVAREMAEAGASILKVPLANMTKGQILSTSKDITVSLGAIPWIVLSSGSAFPLFLEKLRGAMAGGAAGFAAGRSLWSDLITRPNDADYVQVARDRLDQAIGATTGKTFAPMHDQVQ